MSDVKKKHRLRPIAYDEVSLVDSGAAQDAHVLIFKRDTPCGEVPSNKTGAKDGKSKRSKNFDESKHPRKSDGTMDKTSAASKEKYGKGGTTAANRGACGTSKGKKKKSSSKKTTALDTANNIVTTRQKNKKKANKLRNKILDAADVAAKKKKKSSVKKSMTTWDKDARVRAILERKAT